jgi:hypothetical protein
VCNSFTNYADQNHTFGNLFDFGNFDKCFGVQRSSFRGKFCLVQYQSTLNDTIPLTIIASNLINEWKELDRSFVGAICMPASCSADTVRALMEHIFKDTKLQMTTGYDQENFCQTQEEKNIRLIDCVSM